jgi:hypothetical protein
MRYLIALLIFVACNSKKNRLDELYKQRTEVKSQIDSITITRDSILNSVSGIADSAKFLESSSLSAKITVLNSQLRKIDFSIDSLSKY